MTRRKAPNTVVERLPLYARALRQAQRRGVTTISSRQLAGEAGVQDPQLRRDLSYLGAFGTRGVGYNVNFLLHQIQKHLGLLQDWPVVIIGAGRIGVALLHHRNFSSEGYNVIAIFDNDPHVIGKRAGDLTVLPLDRLEELVKASQARIGIITTPAGSAEEVAKQLVESGIKAILNFSPTTIHVPHSIPVRNVDLSNEMKILSYHLTQDHH